MVMLPTHEPGGPWDLVFWDRSCRNTGKLEADTWGGPADAPQTWPTFQLVIPKQIKHNTPTFHKVVSVDIISTRVRKLVDDTWLRSLTTRSKTHLVTKFRSLGFKLQSAKPLGERRGAPSAWRHLRQVSVPEG